MVRRIVLAGALAFSLCGTVAFAQSDAVTAASPAAPATSGRAAWAARGAVFALRGAYRAIAEAQVRGTSPYLDAAKTHYRSALARYAKQDPGAASEAMAASALARAAAAEHPAPAPRDIPAPPEMTAAAGPPGGGMPGPPAGGMHGPPARRHGRGGRFDATKLAADAKLAGTPEAQSLAQQALDADLARTRAAFGGNRAEAQREATIAGALAQAVGALARAEHPEIVHRPFGRGGRSRPAGGDGVVGVTDNG